MTKRSWRLVTRLTVVTVLLGGMGSYAVVPAVAQTTERANTPTATTAVLNEAFGGNTLPIMKR